MSSNKTVFQWSEAEPNTLPLPNLQSNTKGNESAARESSDEFFSRFSHDSESIVARLLAARRAALIQETVHLEMEKTLTVQDENTENVPFISMEETKSPTPLKQPKKPRVSTRQSHPPVPTHQIRQTQFPPEFVVRHVDKKLLDHETTPTVDELNRKTFILSRSKEAGTEKVRESVYEASKYQDKEELMLRKMDRHIRYTKTKNGGSYYNGQKGQVMPHWYLKARTAEVAAANRHPRDEISWTKKNGLAGTAKARKSELQLKGFKANGKNKQVDEEQAVEPWPDVQRYTSHRHRAPVPPYGPQKNPHRRVMMARLAHEFEKLYLLLDDYKKQTK